MVQQLGSFIGIGCNIGECDFVILVQGVENLSDSRKCSRVNIQLLSVGLVTEFLLWLRPAMAVVGDRHALLELLFADFVVKWQAAAAVKSKTEDVNKVVKYLAANGYKKPSMVKSTDEADTNIC